MIPSRRQPCKHCRRVKAAQARGLCRVCWERHRDLYPRLRETAPKSGPAETEADVEALVEEQRRRLPDWWERG